MFVDVCGICSLFFVLSPRFQTMWLLWPLGCWTIQPKEFIGRNIPKWPVTSYYITFSIYNTLYYVTAYDSMWCYIICSLLCLNNHIYMFIISYHFIFVLYAIVQHKCFIVSHIISNHILQCITLHSFIVFYLWYIIYDIYIYMYTYLLFIQYILYWFYFRHHIWSII